MYYFENQTADPILKKLGIHNDEYRFDYAAMAQDLNRMYETKDETGYYKLLRYMGKLDFFFFCYFILELPVNHPFLHARIIDAQNKRHLTLDLWSREHWKALWVGTPVLTLNGWKNHGDLAPGDMVFGSDGTPTRVVAVTKKFKNSRQYEITFNHKHKIISSSDHIWAVEKRSSKRISGTDKRLGRIEALMTTDEIHSHGCVQDKRLCVETSFVEYSEKKYHIHPYVLGAWLGDGTSACSNITGIDGDIFRRMRDLGYEIYDTSVGITKRVAGLITKLKMYNLKNNKHIPEEYKTGSFQQRIELIRGLMDTDGTVDGRNRCTFVNKNKRLAEDFYEVATSLGMNPTLSTFVNKKLEDPEYVFYNVSFAGRKNINPFYIKRKSDKIYIEDKKQYRFITDISPLPDGKYETNCIQVESADGIYLAGRELIKTHNSTILTFALPLWEVIQHREERIVIFSHTRTLAKSHLRRIKHTLQECRRLINTYPDIFYNNPESESPKWSEDEGLYVKRTRTFPEATFEAWGLIDSSPIGKHWSIMIYDDLVTEKSVSTSDQIRKATDAFRLSLNLGTRNGVRRVIGTRYSHKDSYSELIPNSKWTIRIYPAEVDDEGKAKRGGTPVFLTTPELDEKYDLMGEYIYSSQILQNPTAESMQGFKEFWLKYWQKNRPYMNYYCVVDPASSKKKDSDYTVMVVIGTDSLRNYWLVDMVRDRLNLKEKWEKLKGLVTTWDLKEVAYEKSGLSTDGEYFRQMMEEEGFFFHIKDLNRKNAKTDRIKRLVPLFQKGRFIIPRSLVYEDISGGWHDLTQEFVDEEYLFFPYSKHDDCLDAMSSILDSEIGVTFPTRKAEHIEDEDYNDPFERKESNSAGSWMSN